MHRLAALALALAPKSNSVKRAFGEAKRDADLTASEPVPMQLRNAPTGLMKNSEPNFLTPVGEAIMPARWVR